MIFQAREKLLQYPTTVIPVQPVQDLPEADQSVLEFQADSDNNDSGAHSAKPGTI